MLCNVQDLKNRAAKGQYYMIDRVSQVLMQCNNNKFEGTILFSCTCIFMLYS
jgi:hypothetical protein